MVRMRLDGVVDVAESKAWLSHATQRACSPRPPCSRGSKIKMAACAGDCDAGDYGEWRLAAHDTLSWLHSAQACLTLCRRCPRCSWVSISVSAGERSCTWSTNCTASGVSTRASTRSGPALARLPIAVVRLSDPHKQLPGVPVDFGLARPGSCGNIDETSNDCERGLWGAWELKRSNIPDLRGCVQRCLGCANCHYVTFSDFQEESDCRWYRFCDMQRLQNFGQEGRGGYLSLPVRSSPRLRSRAARLAALAPPPTGVGTPSTQSAVAPLSQPDVSGFCFPQDRVRAAACEAGRQVGRWQGISTFSGCVEKCKACKACRFVSYAAGIGNGDCNWHARCPAATFVARHGRKPPLHPSRMPINQSSAYMTRRVRGGGSDRLARQGAGASAADGGSLRNRTLAVVLSETRMAELTFARFEAFVLKPLRAELALCVSEADAAKAARRSAGEAGSNGFYRNARYVWTFPEYVDYGAAFDEVLRHNHTSLLPGSRCAAALRASRKHPKALSACYSDLLAVPGDWLGGVVRSGQRGSAAIRLYAQWVLSERLRAVLPRYGRVLVTRSDVWWCAPHPAVDSLHLYVTSTHVSDWQEWSPALHNGRTGAWRYDDAINDRHIVYPAHSALRALRVLPRLLADPAANADWMDGRLHRDNTGYNHESVLASHLRSEGLQPLLRTIADLPALVVRWPGTTTRWAKGRLLPELGLGVKYPEDSGMWHPHCLAQLLEAAAARRA